MHYNMKTRSQTSQDYDTKDLQEPLKPKSDQLVLQTNPLRLGKVKVSPNPRLSTLKTICSSRPTISNNIKSYKTKNNSIHDLWLYDEHIEAYYNSLRQSVSQYRNDILLIGPSISEMLGHSSTYDILSMLTPLKFNQMSLVFFPISNNTIKDHKQNTNGSHWSLLIFDKKNNIFKHYDSIKGLNYNHAVLLAKQINPNIEIIEMETLQQTCGFECGIHVIVNTVSAINSITERNVTSKVDATNPESINTKDYDKNIKLSRDNIEFSEKSGLKTFRKKFKTKVLTKELVIPVKCTNRFSPLLISDREKDYKNLNVPNVSFTEKSLNETNNSLIFPEEIEIVNPNNKRSQNLKHTSKYCKIDNTKFELLNDKCTQGNTYESDQKHEPSVGHKINIVADSHGRKLREMIQDDCKNYNVYSSIKPNVKMLNILKDAEKEVKTMTTDDFIVIIGGTNDITNCLNEKYIPNKVEKTIQCCSNTNVIVSAIPYRYDLPHLNRKIYYINSYLQKLCDKYSNTHFLSLDALKRYHYTNHGIHLNSSGKLKMSTTIVTLMKGIEARKNGTMTISTIIGNRHCFLGKPEYVKYKT